MALNADLARFGSAQAQLNDDICASYRRQHDPSTLIYDARGAKRTARFDLASCDLQTALMAFQEQPGFEYSIATAPLPPASSTELRVQAIFGPSTTSPVARQPVPANTRASARSPAP